MVPAFALPTYSQTALKGKAAKRKHELLRWVLSLPWKHRIEAVRPDLGLVLCNGRQKGVLRGGLGPVRGREDAWDWAGGPCPRAKEPLCTRDSVQAEVCLHRNASAVDPRDSCRVPRGCLEW